MRTVALMAAALAGAALIPGAAHADTVMFELTGASLRGADLVVHGTVSCATEPAAAHIRLTADQGAGPRKGEAGITCDGERRDWNVPITGTWRAGEPVRVSGGLYARNSFSVVEQIVTPA